METKSFAIGQSVRNVMVSGYNARYIAYRETYVTAYVLDTQTGRIIYRITQPHYITSLAFSSDGNLIAVGSSNCQVTIHNLNTHTLIDQYRHSDKIRSVAFSPCGKLIASSSDGRTIVRNIEQSTNVSVNEVWNQRHYKVEFLGSSHEVGMLHDSMFDMQNIKNSRIVFHHGFATGGGNPFAELNDDREACELLTDYVKLPTDFEFDSTTRRVAVKCGTTLQIFDVVTGMQIGVLENKESKDENVKRNLGGKEPQKIEHPRKVLTKDDCIDSFKFDSAGSMMICATKRSIKVWSLVNIDGNGQLIPVILANYNPPILEENEPIYVGFCNDGKTMFVKSPSDHDIRFYDSPKLEMMQTFLMARCRSVESPLQRFFANTLFDLNVVRLIFENL